MRAEHHCPFDLDDLGGAGIDRAAKFIERLTHVDVTSDPAWVHIKGLQALRNVVAHEGGNRPVKTRPAISALIERHPGLLTHPNRGSTFDGYEQLDVKIGYCRLMTDHVWHFFERQFPSLGLPGSDLVPPDDGPQDGKQDGATS
jgi:hypothetical protein